MHMSTILQTRLDEFQQMHPGRELEILETGTIRQDTEAHRQGDGWSTLTFAQWVAEHGGHVTSIDLHIATAGHVIDREGMDRHVTLIRGYSVDMMAAMLADGERFDVILLDSENDAALILHEFMIAKQLLRRPGLILVDDVVPGSATVVKGAQLAPWLESHGIEYDITARTGGGVHSGVLATILP